jgi:23S rRNA (adenine2503-C2)-methyltransferase
VRNKGGRRHAHASPMTSNDTAPTQTSAKPRLRGMTPEELRDLLSAGGHQPFRAKQLFHWIHAKGARSFEEMTNLPKGLRDWLHENTVLGGIEYLASAARSQDGSTKFLFGLHDGRKIEAVLMPDRKRGYYTMCVSSQVGCAVDCKFCLTGANGFFRHLGADEIADQVLYGRRHLADQGDPWMLRNIVYMGMGEPLLNTDNVVKSIRLLTHGDGANMSGRRITVSTSGIVPGIDELAAAKTGVRLAISLNAPNQSMREKIMPIARRWPLPELIEAVKRFPQRHNMRPTFEYVLLAGVNDSPSHAREVARLLRGFPCKVNLIPFNPNPALPYRRPDTDVVDAFAQVLLDANYTVSVRWSKALDVSGACGNLAHEARQRRTPGIVQATSRKEEEAVPEDLDFFAIASATVEQRAEDDDEE